MDSAEVIVGIWKLVYVAPFNRINILKKFRSGEWEFIESIENATVEDFEKEVAETRKIWE